MMNAESRITYMDGVLSSKQRHGFKQSDSQFHFHFHLHKYHHHYKLKKKDDTRRQYASHLSSSSRRGICIPPSRSIISHTQHPQHPQYARRRKDLAHKLYICSRPMITININIQAHKEHCIASRSTKQIDLRNTFPAKLPDTLKHTQAM